MQQVPASLLRLSRIPFVRDVTTLQAGTWLTMIMQFASSIVLARVLGARAVGLYALTFTIVGTVGMLTDLGQNYSVTTLLPEAYGKRSKQEVEEVIAYFVRIALWWVFPITILLVVCTPWLIERFYPGNDIVILVRLALVTLLFLPAHDLVTLALQGARKIPALMRTELLYNILDLGLPLAMLFWERSVTALVLGRLIAAATKAGISLLLWRGNLRTDPLMPSLRVVLRSLPSIPKRRGLSLGLWIAADKQMSKLANYIPNYLLALFGSATTVGQYRYMLAYLQLSLMFSTNVGRMMGSVLPFLHITNAQRMRKAFWKGSIGNLIITYTLLIPLVMLGNRGLVFLYGTEFAVPSVIFPLMLIIGLDAITVGFSSIYRIHRALYLTIWLQFASVGSGLLVWWFAQPRVGAFIATVLYLVAASLVSKLCHAVNFHIIRSKEEPA